jgi:hypothetical protein
VQPRYQALFQEDKDRGSLIKSNPMRLTEFFDRFMYPV